MNHTLLERRLAERPTSEAWTEYERTQHALKTMLALLDTERKALLIEAALHDQTRDMLRLAMGRERALTAALTRAERELDSLRARRSA